MGFSSIVDAPSQGTKAAVWGCLVGLLLLWALCLWKFWHYHKLVQSATRIPSDTSNRNGWGAGVAITTVLTIICVVIVVRMVRQ